MLLPSIFALASCALAAPAPLHVPRGVDALIADKYIVKLKDSALASALGSSLSAFSTNVERVYSDVFNGFAATLDETELSALREHPDVEYVEQDAIVSIAAYVTQANAPWNLARISSRRRGATNYVYDESAGIGSCVYIIDTGVDSTHPGFGGRAVQAVTFAGTNADVNGHGTAVAGIVGSITHGVAKKATIIGVKVLGDDGSGSISNIIAGFNWVQRDSQTRNCPRGVMVNVSLGGGFSSALNSAVRAVAQSNKLVAVAAGNEGSNVANFSPASESTACTVGATTAADTATTTSNYGPLIDLWAPGQSIVTTWLNGGTNTLSGSSLAAPHVAGLGAYLATLEGVPPGQLCARMQQLATKDVLTGVPAGTINAIIFNGNPTG